MSRTGRRITPPSLAPLLAGVAGGALLAARPRRRDAHAISTIAALCLIALSARTPIMDAIRQAGTRRRSAVLQLSFVVAHPVEKVFGFCADFENFPRFIRALREVHDYSDGRSHWCATTPSGGTVEWDTVISKYVPNHVIAWRSVGTSSVEAHGAVRFTPEAGGTCVKVSTEYRVLESGLADALYALATPPRADQLEADIRRISLYLGDDAATATSA